MNLQIFSLTSCRFFLHTYSQERPSQREMYRAGLARVCYVTCSFHTGHPAKPGAV